jgi:sodium/potassium-transporting ATPase subunit alpha
MPSQCLVIRDAKTVSINAKELVLGDIVYLRSGDKIPADLMLFNSNELKVATLR